MLLSTIVTRNSPVQRQSVRNFISARFKKKPEIAAEETEVQLTRKQKIVNYFRETRIKRTEQAVDYVKMVKYDYTEALKEISDFGKSKPFKFSIYSALLGFGLVASYNNPDEQSFKSNYIENCHELRQVGDPVRNPASEKLNDYVSRAFNAGI